MKYPKTVGYEPLKLVIKDDSRPNIGIGSLVMSIQRLHDIAHSLSAGIGLYLNEWRLSLVTSTWPNFFF
jgi:hypothetical protein